MKKCILVVEDQEDNRQILRDLLTSGGFDMVEAETAKKRSRLRRPTSRT